MVYGRSVPLPKRTIAEAYHFKTKRTTLKKSHLLQLSIIIGTWKRIDNGYYMQFGEVRKGLKWKPVILCEYQLNQIASFTCQIRLILQ